MAKRSKRTREALDDKGGVRMIRKASVGKRSTICQEKREWKREAQKHRKSAR